MRVISGSAKGTKLLSPQGLRVRPTSGMTKEAFFNTVACCVNGCNFLDLFCGSGSIGIEALSRGASSVFFVDASSKSISLAKKNLEKTHLSQNASLFREAAVDAVMRLGRMGATFDLIFLDPPYFAGHVKKTLDAIVSADILADGGIAAAEQGRDEETPRVSGLAVFDTRRYSSCRLIYLRKEKCL